MFQNHNNLRSSYDPVYGTGNKSHSPNHHLSELFLGTTRTEDRDVASSRDLLLIKCKSAIQELHQEIEKINREQNEIDEKRNQLESQVKELDQRNQVLINENQHYLQELHSEKSKVLQLNQKAFSLGEQAKQKQQFEGQVENFSVRVQELEEENEQLNNKIDQLTSQLQNRDNLSVEWESTIKSVSYKLENLENQNRMLLLDREELMINLEKLSKNLQVSEHKVKSFENQLDKYSNFKFEIEEREKMIDHLQDENKDLGNKIIEFQKMSDDQRRQISNDFEQREKQLLQQLSQKDSQLNEIEELLKKDINSKTEQIQSSINSAQQQVEKYKTLYRQAQEDLKKAKAEIEEREIKAQIAHEEFSISFEKLQNESSNQVHQIQKLNEEQSLLLEQYERMIYREQQEREKDCEISDFEAKKQRDNIIELTHKNQLLNEKLLQCQRELKNLQMDVMKQFDIDEERNRDIMAKVRDMESLIGIKDQAIDTLRQEMSVLQASSRKMNHDATYLSVEKKSLLEEITEQNARFNQIIREKEIIQAKNSENLLMIQKELENALFQVENLHNEKNNFKQKIQELEIKLIETQEYYNQELNILTQQNLLKDRQFDHLKNKYDQSVKRILEKKESVDFRIKESEIEPSNIGRRLFQGSHYSYGNDNELSVHTDSQRNLREKQQRKVTHDDMRPQSEAALLQEKQKKTQQKSSKEKLNLKEYATNQVDSSSNSESVAHGEFINRFKQVINRLENQLEQMSTELNLKDELAQEEEKPKISQQQ